MKLRTTLLAATALSIAVAFENKPTWKMDGDKLALDGEGNPILIAGDGTETSVKVDTVPRLNADMKQLRTAKEAAEAEAKKFLGPDGKPIDPTTALKAIETVANIDAKKLIDAGEVEKVREQIKAEYDTQLSERDKALSERDNQINTMRIDSVFAGSEFINERVAMPRDFFEAAMRNNFKVEDGKVVAYDKAGNRIMSKKDIGSFAEPNEALELLVEQHPQRDTILKAVDAGGTGNDGKGGNRGGARRIARADFDALPAPKQAELAGAMGKGEVQIVD